MTYTVKTKIYTSDRVLRDTLRNVSESTVALIRESVRQMTPTGGTYSVEVKPER